MEREAKIGRVQEPIPKSKEDKFKNTIAFLKTAIAEGAHLKRPLSKSGSPSEDEWVRQRNIVGVYFGSPATLEDIGRIYGITREMVRLIKYRGIRNLWRNCTVETQAVFPFEDLELRKPRTQKSRERNSRSGGGISISIRDQMASGKPVKQILEEGSYSALQIQNARETLKGWGVEAAYIYTPHSKNLELEKNLKKADTDEKKQELLNQVKSRFYQDHVKGENPLMATLTSIVLEAELSLGFRKQNVPIFVVSLKKVRFPMGEVHGKQRSKTGEEKIATYHFLLAKDKERAKQILLADPNLQRFRRS